MSIRIIAYSSTDMVSYLFIFGENKTFHIIKISSIPVYVVMLMLVTLVKTRLKDEVMAFLQSIHVTEKQVAECYCNCCKFFKLPFCHHLRQQAKMSGVKLILLMKRKMNKILIHFVPCCPASSRYHYSVGRMQD